MNETVSPPKSECSPGCLKQEKAGFVGGKAKLSRVDNTASSEGNGAGQETSALGKLLRAREWKLQRKQHRNLSGSGSNTSEDHSWAEHHWPSPERDFRRLLRFSAVEVNDFVWVPVVP